MLRQQHSSLQFEKYQSSHFATLISKVSTETQSIGIHDVHVFNTELAMHYRAIFNWDCFRLFYERRETL